MTSFPLQQCDSCAGVFGHPVSRCRLCGSETFEILSVGNRGEVYASTTVRVPDTDFVGEEPFVVAVIDLTATVDQHVDRQPSAEPVRVTARIRGSADVRAGDPVAFVERAEDIFWFEPV